MKKLMALSALTFVLGSAAPVMPMLSSIAEADHDGRHHDGRIQDDEWSLATCIRLRKAVGAPTRGCYPRTYWWEVRPLPPGLRRPETPDSHMIGESDQDHPEMTGEAPDGGNAPP